MVLTVEEKQLILGQTVRRLSKQPQHPLVHPLAADDAFNLEETPAVYINDTEVPTIIHSINDDGSLVEVEDVMMVF